MKSTRLWSAFLFAICMLNAVPVAAGDTVRVSRWQLHNSFWINLHEALMQGASTRQSVFGDARLSAEETTAWTNAITAYRAAAGEGSITFSNAMMQVQDALTQAADDAAIVQVSGPLGDALRAAARSIAPIAGRRTPPPTAFSGATPRRCCARPARS